MADLNAAPPAAVWSCLSYRRNAAFPIRPRWGVPVVRLWMIRGTQSTVTATSRAVPVASASRGTRPDPNAKRAGPRHLLQQVGRRLAEAPHDAARARYAARSVAAHDGVYDAVYAPDSSKRGSAPQQQLAPRERISRLACTFDSCNSISRMNKR